MYRIHQYQSDGNCAIQSPPRQRFHLNPKTQADIYMHARYLEQRNLAGLVWHLPCKPMTTTIFHVSRIWRLANHKQPTEDHGMKVRSVDK